MKAPAILAILFFSLASSINAEEPDPSALLRAKDQALLNAIPAGDRAAWERVTAPTFVYVAEDSTVVERADFLKVLVPSPPYDVPPLQIHDHKVYVLGDTAITVHHDDEVGVHLGSKLTGQYLTTETWQRIDGEWWLRSVHTNAVPADPSAVALSPAQIDEVVGTYSAESVIYTIRRDGNRILSKPSDGPEKEWKAETRDTFFVPGRTRQRAVFRRDAAGKVTGFSWRNENRSVVFTRMN